MNRIEAIKMAAATAGRSTVPIRWTNYGLGFVLGGLLIFAAWPPIKRAIWWLASQPDVATIFQDPRYGRQDAWLSLFTFTTLVPIAALLFIWVFSFLYALPAGFVFPLGRRFGIPEWVSTIFVLALSGAVVYSQSDVWVGPCLRSLGVLARAWVTIVQ
jgi:hypothetical protein